ncbi:hypothetical protein ACQKGO_34060 [Corallococcus interemptor]|uniref:hypothetical protein n=1 Tax=Corallococcus interemptor TaxID=2316720 RepID=UPI001315536D|nr:hypothetical protein [Corallococcus interemptor]
MGEHESPRKEPQLPEDEQQNKRQAGDRPMPTPGHIGNLPDNGEGPGGIGIKLPEGGGD